MTSTSSRITAISRRKVSSRLEQRARAGESFFFFFAPAKSFSSRECMGTLMTKAMPPPRTRGNRMPQKIPRAFSTISRRWIPVSSRTVKVIRSMSFFIVCLEISMIILRILPCIFEPMRFGAGPGCRPEAAPPAAGGGKDKHFPFPPACGIMSHDIIPNGGHP